MYKCCIGTLKKVLNKNRELILIENIGKMGKWCYNDAEHNIVRI